MAKRMMPRLFGFVLLAMVCMSTARADYDIANWGRISHLPEGLTSNSRLGYFADRLWDYQSFQSFTTANGATWNSAPMGYLVSVMNPPVVFKDRMWIYMTDAPQRVFSTLDGVNWTSQSLSGTNPFFRNFIQFGDRLYSLPQGSASGLIRPTVFSTADGLNWRVDIEEAPFEPTTNPQRRYTVNGSLFVYAQGVGFPPSKYTLWRTSNGADWSQVTIPSTPADVTTGTLHFFSHRQSAWAADGTRVWQTFDGINWTTRTDVVIPALPVVSRPDGSLICTSVDRTWISNDPTRWHELGHMPGYYRAGEGPSCAFGIRLLHLTQRGGNAFLATSTDGLNWDERAVPIGTGRPQGWLTRFDRFVELNGQLYLINLYYRDCWRSADGLNWVQMRAPAFDAAQARYGYAIASFGSKIWVVGGYLGTSLVTQVLSSTNGVDWVEEAADAGVGYRNSSSMIEHAGALVLVGVRADAQGTAIEGDVWRSTNGVNWTKLYGEALFPRYLPGLASAEGKLWAWSGVDAPPSPTQPGYTFYSGGVQCSDDGTSWTSCSSPPLPGSDAPLLKFGGQFWVLGQRASEGVYRTHEAIHTTSTVPVISVATTLNTTASLSLAFQSNSALGTLEVGYYRLPPVGLERALPVFWQITGLTPGSFAVILVFHYEDADVTALGIEETDLRIYMLGANQLDWAPITCIVDPVGNTITTLVPQTSFSTWALAGEQPLPAELPTPAVLWTPYE